MVSQVIRVANPTGFDVKPAGSLCKEAMKFKCQITYRYNETDVANAKSVLSVLGSIVRYGDEIELICDGEDEEAALVHLIAYLEAGLED
ncbi:MAG: HPr family phosphocarrier protein [Agathobacter sp.]|nr:HPr family phosphocarrier protein [Agathobacter sp.]